MEVEQSRMEPEPESRTGNLLHIANRNTDHVTLSFNSVSMLVTLTCAKRHV